MQASIQPRLASVRDFMSKHVQTISSGSTVDEAINKMAKHNVGSLVVMGGLGPKGLLSERDLVSKLVATGKTPEKTLVTEVMSGQITRFHPEQSLREAAQIMNSLRNRLLVFEDDHIIGIVTATDIVRGIHEMNYTFDIDKGTMKSVYTVKNETSLKEAIEVMSQLRIGSLITMKNDEPDGIFTEWDLVRNVLAPHLALESHVGDQASRPLMTAEEGIGGRQAASIMTINHIKRLPLTRRGVIAGIVTARDLVEAFACSQTTDAIRTRS
ncbi:MAG TPA: CBS domain-containing protein [Candidatus Bathyarchaeia archaeon]|nr:CBS domain-containing protein [Candidatus Bathyarchaeia archaeon]